MRTVSILMLAILLSVSLGRAQFTNKPSSLSTGGEYVRIKGTVTQVLDDGLLVSARIVTKEDQQIIKAAMARMDLIKKESAELTAEIRNSPNNSSIILSRQNELLTTAEKELAKIESMANRPLKTYKIICSPAGYADEDKFNEEHCSFEGTYQYVNSLGVQNTVRKYRVHPK